MSSSGSSVSTDSDPVVGFRKPSNMTSPDFRAAFALDAKDLLALRTLCDHVEDDEFQTVMIITIVGIAELLDTARKEKAEASCPDLFRTMFMSSSATSSSASSSSYNQMCPRQRCPRGLNESMSISSLSGGSSRSHDDNALEIDTAFANQPMPMYPMPMYTYSDEDLDDLSSSESDIDPFRPHVVSRGLDRREQGHNSHNAVNATCSNNWRVWVIIRRSTVAWQS
eukprot:scaffold10262_cov131-Chaetoceros_neogracile.AAC.1